METMVEKGWEELEELLKLVLVKIHDEKLRKELINYLEIVHEFLKNFDGNVNLIYPVILAILKLFL